MPLRLSCQNPHASQLHLRAAREIALSLNTLLALQFVQNVDEVIFDSCCPEQVKSDVASTRYRSRDVLTLWGIASKKRYGSIEHVYGMFLHLPVLAALSIILVLTFRAPLDCATRLGA